MLNFTCEKDICGLPPALQVRAALFKQKKAVQHEIALMLSEETELTKSIKEATGDIVDGTRAKGGVDGVEGGSRVGEENTDEGKELDNQRRKGEGVPGEETKIRSTAPAVVGHGERSARRELFDDCARYMTDNQDKNSYLVFKCSLCITSRYARFLGTLKMLWVTTS